jgi:hypothetical protein
LGRFVECDIRGADHDPVARAVDQVVQERRVSSDHLAATRLGSERFTMRERRAPSDRGKT